MGEVVTCSVCLAMSLCLDLGPHRVVGLNIHTDSCNDFLCKDVRHSRRLSSRLFRGTCYRRSAFTSSAGSLVRWCVNYSLLLPGGVKLHSYNASKEDRIHALEMLPLCDLRHCSSTSWYEYLSRRNLREWRWSYNCSSLSAAPWRWGEVTAPCMFNFCVRLECVAELMFRPLHNWKQMPCRFIIGNDYWRLTNVFSCVTILYESKCKP